MRKLLPGLLTLCGFASFMDVTSGDASDAPNSTVSLQEGKGKLIVPVVPVDGQTLPETKSRKERQKNDATTTYLNPFIC